MFGKVIVISIYNPARFWEALRQKGFEINVSTPGRQVTATRRMGKRVARLENISYFDRLCGGFLLSDDSVMLMLEKTIELAEAQGEEGSLRVDIRPILKTST